MSQSLLLEVRDLERRYRLPRESPLRPAPVEHALRGVSFELASGRSLGVVGESGAGKSTLARLVMALEVPDAGSVSIRGQVLHTLSASALRQARQHFQMVFQDPYGSLDPRQKVGRIVAEPLRVLSGVRRADAAAQRSLVLEALRSVGLREADLDKYPHEFSGGQRQRIAIARALVTRPALIVADEPVSALDVSVQAQVLNLMQDLQTQFGVSYLLISHDLAVVSHLCDEVLVLYLGRVVERGTPQRLFEQPAHPYTKALVDAVPPLMPGLARERRPKWAPLATDPPGPSAPATGCAYAPRCPHASPLCLSEAPRLRSLEQGHALACHHALA